MWFVVSLFFTFLSYELKKGIFFTVFPPLNPKREILDVLASFSIIPVFAVKHPLPYGTLIGQEVRALVLGKKYQYPNVERGK